MAGNANMIASMVGGLLNYVHIKKIGVAKKAIPTFSSELCFPATISCALSIRRAV